MHVVIPLALFAAAVLAITAACRRWNLNAPLVLLLVGLIGSFLPFIHEPTLSPELVLVGLLPPLLYSSAVQQSLVEFRQNSVTIVRLSVFLVLFTVAGIGLVAHSLLPIGWAAAFALGAIVAPPDAVAATAVAKSIGLPRRVVTILEGESLVNDATALVSLRSAILALTSAVTVGGVLLDFSWAVLGGVGVGLVVAFVLGKVFSHTDDVVTSTALTFLAPFFAYVPAEEMHASGVLAVVVSGLALGHWSPRMQSGQARLSSRINWSVIAFLLENSVFLLLGLQVRRIVSDARASQVTTGRLVLVCLAVLVAVIGLRMIWTFGGLLFKSIRRRSRQPAREALIISWAGMRGVVTLAAALTLPEDCPERSVLILIALAVTVGTLVIQGTTLPALARALDVPGPDPREDALQEAILYQRAGRAAVGVLHEKARPEDALTVARIEQQIETRTNAAWERIASTADNETPADAYRRLRLKALKVERREVLAARDAGDSNHEAVQHVLTSLDAEEAALARISERSEQLRTTPLRPALPTAPCEHLAAAGSECMKPSTETCPECIEEGLEPVHLRLCLTCGHVGCCDSSLGRHATAHFHQTGHPVMRSIEPGESWRWCYIDEVTAAAEV